VTHSQRCAKQKRCEPDAYEKFAIDLTAGSAAQGPGNDTDEPFESVVRRASAAR